CWQPSCGIRFISPAGFMRKSMMATVSWLLSRNAKDRTQMFSSVAQMVAALPHQTLLLDGEVVAFDSRNVSRFQLLQERKSEPSYAVFDCLYVNGKDLRSHPLTRRRTALEQAAGAGGEASRLLLAQRLASNGLDAYRVAQRKRYEGVVAKDARSEEHTSELQ